MNNGKFKRELGVTLRYPTYREGLRTLFEGGAVATDKILPGRQRIQAGAATIARRAAIDVKWTLFLGFTYFLLGFTGDRKCNEAQPSASYNPASPQSPERAKTARDDGSLGNGIELAICVARSMGQIATMIDAGIVRDQ